jgi:tRNA 2-thiouridine synthesizing protein A
MQIDVRGRSCPIPLMETKKALVASPAALTVLVSSGTARAHVTSLLRDEGFTVEVAEDGDAYRIEAQRVG